MDENELEELMTVFFFPCSAWQCNMCGQLVGTEHDYLEEHFDTHTEKEITECRKHYADAHELK